MQKYILTYKKNPCRCLDIVFDDDYYVVDYVNKEFGQKLFEDQFEEAKKVLKDNGLIVTKMAN